MQFHLAQLNVARLRAPLDHQSIDDFRNGLAPVNALADSASGFVWRLQTDDGDATSVRLFDDPLIIVNLTVWEDLHALRAFAYAGTHRDFLRRKSEWFGDTDRRSALWYVPAGHVPTVGEAKARLHFLDTFGESSFVFSTPRERTPLVVHEHPLLDAVSTSLIRDLNAELAQLYPEPGSNHFTLLPEQVAAGVGAFVVAWSGDQAVGCGAVRLVDPRTAEIKRMYVLSSARGARVGAAVLYELESQAVALGATRLVLETGTRQHAAISLYRRADFSPCACWGEYDQVPTSVCFDKRLDGCSAAQHES
jgi:putative acetyltransferase